MSRYKLVQADSDKLDEFYNDSSLTFEGCTTDEKNIDYIRINFSKEIQPDTKAMLDSFYRNNSFVKFKYGITLMFWLLYLKLFTLKEFPYNSVKYL